MKRFLFILLIIPFFQAGQTQADNPHTHTTLDTVSLKIIIQHKADSAALQAVKTIDSVCQPVKYKRGPVDIEKRADGRIRKWIGIFKTKGKDTIGFKTVIKQIQ
jgi:hypothetical protein